MIVLRFSAVVYLWSQLTSCFCWEHSMLACALDPWAVSQSCHWYVFGRWKTCTRAVPRLSCHPPAALTTYKVPPPKSASFFFKTKNSSFLNVSMIILSQVVLSSFFRLFFFSSSDFIIFWQHFGVIHFGFVRRRVHKRHDDSALCHAPRCYCFMPASPEAQPGRGLPWVFFELTHRVSRGRSTRHSSKTLNPKP